MASKQVFHSTDLLRRRVDVILVRPEEPGNIGSAARALENMGIRGDLHLIAEPHPLPAQAFRMAKHAGERLNKVRFSPNLGSALKNLGPSLVLAATARVGSSHRPHPLNVDVAVPRALEELRSAQNKRLVLVFGPESSGLDNEDVAQCDWVVTIPSDSEYRSLNLAQAVLIFAYEVQKALTTPLQTTREIEGLSQRGKIIRHFLDLAESVGFILPGDPMKMRPRLSEILSQLPPHIEGAPTLHGLLAQAIRSVKEGSVVIKGRYRRIVEKNATQGLEVSARRTYNEPDKGAP